MFPGARIIYNTLYHTENQSTIGIDRFIPSSLANPNVDHSKIVGITEVVEGISDITNPQFADSMIDTYPVIDMIACDAEGAGWDDIWKGISITESLVTIASKTYTQLLIMKSYASRMDLLMMQSLTMSSIFTRTAILRSHFSGCGNTEIYFSGSRPRPHAVIPQITVSEESSTIKGHLWPIEEVDQISERILSHSDFNKDCGLLVDQYYKVILRDPRARKIEPKNLEYLSRFLTHKELVLPIHILEEARISYKLKKFSPGTRSKTTPSLLSPKIVKLLFIRFVSWSLCTRRDDQIFEREQNIGKFRFVIYLLRLVLTMPLHLNSHKI